MYACLDLLEFDENFLKRSYGSLNYANYGLWCWRYSGGYLGPVHWLNVPKIVIQEDFVGRAEGYNYFLRPGVIYGCIFRNDNWEYIPSAKIGATEVNLLTGEGLPFAAPQ